MYIRFDSVELENFGSVGKAEFSLSPGIFHVKGINEDNDGSESNGSGKSTIFSESFRWIIYGSTSKKLSSDGVVNDRVGKDCKGVLRAFITDDSGLEFPVKITRYREHSTFENKVELEVNGRQETRKKVADTQKEIERVFRLPISVFSSVYLMEQGLESKFTSMSNVDSKNYIESLRNVKVWDTAYFKASSTLKKKNSELQKVTSVTGQNSAVINSKSKEIFRLGESVLKVKESLEVENFTEKLSKLKKSYSEGIEKLTKDKPAIDKLIEDLPALKESVKTLQSIFSEDKASLKVLNNSLQSVKSKLGNLTCSACGRDFDNKEKAEEHIKSEITRIGKEIEVATEKFNSSLDSYNKENEKLEAKETLLESSKKAFNSFRETLVKMKSSMNTVSSEENVLRERMKTLQKSQESLNSEISDLKESNKLAKEAEEELSKEIPYYKELVNIFSFKGVRSYLISNDLEFLNEKLREFSTYMFSDMIIQFYPNLNKEGMVVSIETIAILSSGVERIYKKLSGGERRRADICIQLSIREFVRRIYNVDTNLFSLDEIFDGLDSEGIYNVMELINEVSSPNTTIFVISFQTVQHSSGGTITVIKSNGVSKIAD